MASIADRTVFRSTVASVIGQSFRLGVTFITTLLSIRWLEPEQFGFYTLITAQISFVQYLISCGFEHSLVYFLPKLLQEGRRGHAQSLFMLAIVTTLLLGVIGMAAYAALTIGLFPERPRIVLVASFVLFLQAAVLALGAVLSGFLRAIHAFRIVILKDFFVQPVITLGAVWVIMHWGARSVLSYSMALLFAALASNLLAAPIILRWLSPRSRASSQQVRSWLAFSVPLAVLAGAEVLFGSICTVLLSFYAAPEAVGNFGAYFRLAVMLQVVLFAVGPLSTVFFVRTGQEAMKKDGSQARIHRYLIAISVLWCTWAAWQALLFPEMSRGLLGRGYEAGLSLLYLLIPGFFAEATLGISKFLLLAHGNGRLLLLDTVGAIILNVILAIVLIPRFGPAGAAVAFSGAQFILSVVRTLQVRLRYGLKPITGYQAFSLISGGAVLIVITVMGRETSLQSRILLDVFGTIMLVMLQIPWVRQDFGPIRQYMPALIPFTLRPLKTRTPE